MKYLGFLFACVAATAAPVAVRCGKLLDVRAGALRTDVVVIVDNGKIAQIGPAASVPAPGSGTSLDLSRGTCLPGLIDVHDHLTSDPREAGYKSLGISDTRRALIGAKNARLTL